MLIEAHYTGGVGIDRRTGRVKHGFPHVLQSLGVIFTTSFGERVMREWFGSAVPMLLGENMVESTFVNYFSAICASIELWEPRFRIKKIQPLSVDRLGRARFEIDGEYRPRGHLGDPSPAQLRRVIADGGVNVNWIVTEQF